LVEQLREEYEKNLQHLGMSFNDERQRQLDLIQLKLADRKEEVEVYRKQVEEEAMRAAEAAAE